MEPAAARAIHVKRTRGLIRGSLVRGSLILATDDEPTDAQPRSRLFHAIAAHKIPKTMNPPGHAISCMRVATRGSIKIGYAIRAISAPAFESANNRYGSAHRRA